MNKWFQRDDREAKRAIAYLDILGRFRPDLSDLDCSTSMRRFFEPCRLLRSLGHAEWPAPPCSPGPPPRGHNSEHSRGAPIAHPAFDDSEGTAMGRLAPVTPGDSPPQLGWGGPWITVHWHQSGQHGRAGAR